ncbi:MAG TPA: hypothetical protein VEW68_08025 [Patescibacteria group bacterium]|nr:hypothetical protein [Patescibacteria group bacterium]
MSVRRIAAGGAVQTDSSREQPRRQRLGLLFLLSLGGGGVAGALAFIIIWVPTLYALANTNDPVPQLAAKTVFPPAAALHQTVTVYDPPVYHAPQQAPQATHSPSPSPTQSPRPTPSGSPRPTPTDN